MKGSDYNGPIYVWRNLVDFLEKINAEYYQSLQCIDRHTHEYVERLKDEPMLVALMRVELGYYKPQEVYETMRTLSEPENSRTLMAALVSLIYKHVQCFVIYITILLMMSSLKPVICCL